MTNVNRTVVWTAGYEPFGRATVNEDPDGNGVLVKNNVRYAGQYFDAETGLHYNWNRYYDPKIGRYITSDPIGVAGGLNTYTYAYNNPLRYIDPDGLMGYSPGPDRRRGGIPGYGLPGLCFDKQCFIDCTGLNDPPPCDAGDEVACKLGDWRACARCKQGWPDVAFQVFCTIKCTRECDPCEVKKQ